MIVLSLSLVLLCALAFCVEWAAQCGVKNAINELLAQHVIPVSYTHLRAHET